jgi:hypothetical protein
MLNKLFAAAAMAAIAYAVVPANAARMSAGCSGANLTKAESSIEAMADGEGKIAAQKEVARSLRTPCSTARWVRAACISAKQCTTQVWRSKK